LVGCSVYTYSIALRRVSCLNRVPSGEWGTTVTLAVSVPNNARKRSKQRIDDHSITKSARLGAIRYFNLRLVAGGLLFDLLALGQWFFLDVI
jgi:hypothetical protein